LFSSQFVFLNVVLRFRYEDAAIAARARALEALLEPFRTETATAAQIGLTVMRHGRGFLVSQEAPSRNWLCRQRSILVPFLEWVTHQVVAERLRGAITIHAGAVGPADGPVLLIGASGAGKSTLVLELMRAGWHYWSDDLAVIDQTLDCLPYPKPIKFEGRPPRTLKYPRGTVLHFRVGNRAYQYLRPWRIAGFHWGKPSSVRGLVVLKRQSAGKPGMTPLSPARAIEALLDHAGATQADLGERFELMCRVGEQTPAVSLSMGRNVKDNARLIREFVGN
jgi:hypothetical protein